jgi:chromosome segregation protein
MDLILSTRAEDRRYLFEEAAGISRYKMQKKESLRKLEETGENLKRINDVIREVEREKDLKSKQADKTKQYLALRDQFQGLDTKINILKFRELEKKLSRIQEDIESLKQEREAISARVSSISSENEKDEKRKNDIQHQLWELDKRLESYKIRLEEVDKKAEKNRKNILEQQDHLKNIGRKIEERFENRKRLVSEKEKAEKSEIDLRAKIEADKESLAQYFVRRKGKIDSIHKSRDDIENNKRLILENEAALAKLREDLEVVIRQLIQAIDKRKAELQESENERQQGRDSMNRLLKTADEALRRAKSSLELGIIEDALRLLNGIDMDSLREMVRKFESYEDGFRSILFDKTGIHARKEELDGRIRSHSGTIDSLRNRNAELDLFIRKEQEELEDINVMISRIEKDLSKYENDIAWTEKHIQTLNHQVKDVDMQIENHREDVRRSEDIIKSLQAEIEEWEHRLVEYNEKSQSLLKNIAELTAKRTELDQKIHDRRNVSRNDEEELAKIIDRISSMDKSGVELVFRKNNIEDYLWSEYEKKIGDFSKVTVDESQAAGLQENLLAVKRDIASLGPINNLAIEEFKDLKKRFEYYISQKKDIEKAREDIMSVIEEINRTSVEMFLETFREIQKNFSQIFKQLFEGGDAVIELLEPENVLDSGIDINVRPPGKKPKSINLLSGGERALTAIALLFATYMVKPSPFCFLDEIDAPLDEENIGRFIRMLKEFSKSTQFVIVTHNKKTMRISESIYGVTMEEPGVSKVVSFQMSKLGVTD